MGIQKTVKSILKDLHFQNLIITQLTNFIF